MGPPVATPASVELVREDGRAVLRVRGDLTLDGTPVLWRRLDELLVPPPEPPLDLDLGAVRRCDSAGAALLVALRDRLGSGDERAGGRVRAVRVVRASEQVAAMLRLAERVPPPGAPVETPVPDEEGVFEEAGGWAMGVMAATREALGYIGALAGGLAWAVRRPRSVRWRDTVLHMARTGSDALGIVGLIGFLIGVILAFQGVAILSRWGIESYVADGVSLSVVMELGPLLTAIVVAGRSGSAFAAEIGTMKVNEEIDALDTLGLDRTRFLVVPKVVALAAMMPLLCVYADACGIAGGMTIGVASLGMTVDTYLRRTAESLDLWKVTQGFIKGEAYALVVAAIGCLRGLQTRTGAQGVGLATTSAVVTGIFYVIVVDAVLTVIFHHVG